MLHEPTIRALVKTCDGERWLIDSTGERRAGALALRIRKRPHGHRCEWFGLWKLHGVRFRLKLGTWPDLTLSAARQEYAGKVRAVLIRGENPRGGDGNGTVAELFAAYCQKLEGNGSDSVRTIRNALVRLAGRLGKGRVASTVKESDLADALRHFHATSPAMASRMRSYSSSAYNFGITLDNDFRTAKRAVRFGITANPADKLPAVRSKSRSRVLTADELRTWWWEFPTHAEAWTVHLLRVTFLTCGRINEAIKARPADFQLSDLRWNKRVKRREILTSPVGKMAEAEIRAFIASMPAGGMNVSRVSDYVMKFWKANNIPAFQARDLRRTARTWLSDAGEDREVLDLQFSHNTRAGVRQNYDHAARLGDRRKMLARWETMVAGIIGKPPNEKAAA